MSDLKKYCEKFNNLIPGFAKEYIEQLEQQLASLQESECPCQKPEWPFRKGCKACNGTGKLPATHVIVKQGNYGQLIANYAQTHTHLPNWYIDMVQAAQETDDG